jgi:predicted esterase
VNVVSSSLDALREANAARLSSIKAGSPGIEKQLASCRARNQLLTDHPSVVNSAQFLADMNQVSEEVGEEIDAIAAGQNPYHRRTGDTWRVLANGKREIPLRVYAPKAASEEKPLPLLVVLHGMGGDENMFFEAYGAGIVKKIAEEHDLLVASPLTYTFGSDIRTLQALVDDLAADYAIDRSRVYVLGHSMGAGATASLARGHADTIAAACCIAGGSLSPASNTPPVLVVIPELDGVVPPARVRTSAQRAASAGLPVEVREMPGLGHTLAVGIALPEAVNWLLKHSRNQ